MSAFNLNLTKEDFDDFINQDKVLIDLWAPWCSPCRMLGPVIEEVAKENNISLGKVNVDNEEELAARFNCTSIPLVILFSNGKEVKRFVGLKSKEAILEFLAND